MKTKYFIFLILFFLTGNIRAQYITYGTIEPFDESNLDPSFSEFIAGVKTAISNKDIEYIYNILDDNIRFSFGDENPGKKYFRAAWKLDDPGSEFWEAFSGTLNLGIAKCKIHCEFSDYEFPYYQTSNLFDNLDDFFSVLIITSPDAKVYTSPDVNSKVLTTLNYNAISFLDNANGWYSISWEKNKKAYVKESDARTMVGLRGGFQKKNNGWKLVYFIEGD